MKGGALMTERCKSLGEPLDETAIPFQGKTSLLLIDDVWPTPSCGIGYVRELGNFLPKNSRSRTARTARREKITCQAGSRIVSHT